MLAEQGLSPLTEFTLPNGRRVDVAAIGAERLGVAPERLRGMVRLSGGWQTTAADWTAAVDALVTIARGAAAPLPGVTLARPE